MLEGAASLILAIVGGLLFLFIVAYGAYITFYPLFKTVGGGIEALKEQRALKTAEAAEKRKVPKRVYAGSAVGGVPEVERQRS